MSISVLFVEFHDLLFQLAVIIDEGVELVLLLLVLLLDLRELFLLLLAEFLLQLGDDLFLVQFGQLAFLLLLAQFVLQDLHPVVVAVLDGREHHPGLFILDLAFLQELFLLLDHLPLL